MTEIGRVKPRVLKGFRDLTPELMIRKESWLERIRGVFRRYGFVPIDTPALEYAEILLAKAGGETEKQIYRFEDQGGRDVALRFDLTVPFARFAAMHVQKLGTPFRRYHIGPVWRGEKPAPGRFREFWQCDFDVIGTASPLADLETALVIHRLMQALPVGGFKLHLSDRAILSALVDSLGLAARCREVLRMIDKLARIGREAVERELRDALGMEAAAVARVFGLIDLGGSSREVLAGVRERCGGLEAAGAGIERLSVILDGLEAAGVPDQAVRLDMSIARGLDYYTGPIFETYLDDQPALGSVCSGGRYDDLAGYYTGQALPGTGASLGLDRLLDAAVSAEQASARRSTARVLVLCLDGERWIEVVRIAEELRAAGIAVELFPEARKIQRQLQYADRRGYLVAVIAGPAELDGGTVSVKNLGTGVQRSGIPRQDLVVAVRSMLAPAAAGEPG